MASSSNNETTGKLRNASGWLDTRHWRVINTYEKSNGTTHVLNIGQRGHIMVKRLLDGRYVCLYSKCISAQIANHCAHIQYVRDGVEAANADAPPPSDADFSPIARADDDEEQHDDERVEHAPPF